MAITLCVLLVWPLLPLRHTHALSLYRSMLCHAPPHVLPMLFREARGFATRRAAPNVLTFLPTLCALDRSLLALLRRRWHVDACDHARTCFGGQTVAVW